MREHGKTREAVPDSSSRGADSAQSDGGTGVDFSLSKVTDRDDSDILSIIIFFRSYAFETLLPAFVIAFHHCLKRIVFLLMALSVQILFVLILAPERSDISTAIADRVCLIFKQRTFIVPFWLLFHK